MAMERLGRYRVLKHLASGGMSEILLVIGEEGESRVARRLLPEGAADRIRLRRFRRSGEILGQLDHPNIVRLIETGRDGRQPYQILEHITGRNLRQHLLTRSPELRDRLGPVATELASALEHLHDRGFLHLDLKPENVMLAEDPDRVKLIDFDLAVSIVQARAPRKTPGTPTYLAPEQIQRRRPDPRTDLYVFGLIIYEICAGRAAATGATVEEILVRRGADRDRIPPLDPGEHGIPPGLERVVGGCLENDPARRYPSMTIVRHDLQKVFA